MKNTADILKLKNLKLLQGLEGELQLVLELDSQMLDRAKQAARSATEALRQRKEVGVLVERVQQSRSLDANAYFHVLCDKIAKKTGLTLEDVKFNMVVDYGTPQCEISIPQSVKIADIWPYARYIGEHGNNAQYLLYKQTHTLTTGEMTLLINGTISEAQSLGICTMTPIELAKLEKQWEKKHGN